MEKQPVVPIEPVPDGVLGLRCETCQHAWGWDESRETYRCSQLPNGLWAAECPEVGKDFFCAYWERRVD